MKTEPTKTLFVNLYGGPCAGKSTIALHLAAELKWNRISTEIITEYAKQLVWEESFPKMRNQIYILGKQHNKQFTLNGKVDVAVTDSPFILSLVYDEGRTEHMTAMAIAEFNKLRNLNIFIERAPEYDPNGRTQKTIEEAMVKDEEIKKFLSDNNIEYITVPFARASVGTILDTIKIELKHNGDNN
jgi:nicotinamide riboside kinase